MVRVKIMNQKGHEEDDMSKQQLLALIDKMGKNKHFLVNTETNEMIRDIEQINEASTITIMPVISGGSF